MTTRRNLVIVRAGKNSLHPNWLDANHTRNWDLIVSWYDDDVYKTLADEKVVRIKGGKFDGLFRTVSTFDNLLANYDYVWLPDDDILTSQSDINKLFTFMRKFELTVAQPSLNWDSYYSILLTLNSPSFKLRYVTFVEVMVACMRVDLLQKILPHFENNMTLWGMDVIWCRLENDNFRKSAIIDEIQVLHTRPVGHVLAGKATASGHNTLDEMLKLLARFGVKESFADLMRSYDGIYANGNCPKSEFLQQLVWLFDMLKFSIFAKHNPIKINRVFSRLRKLLVKSLIRRSSLAKLKDVNLTIETKIK